MMNSWLDDFCLGGGGGGFGERIAAVIENRGWLHEVGRLAKSRRAAHDDNFIPDDAAIVRFGDDVVFSIALRRVKLNR